MTGTWVNVGGIIVGSLLGLLLKKGIPVHINDAIIKAQGLGVIIIALNGILTAMLKVDPATGALTDSGGLLVVISLVVGCIAGELLRIDDRLNNFGRWVEGKMGAAGFARGFVTASLLFPIGAMGVIGSIQDGLGRGSQILFMKSMLDFTFSVVLTASLGIGVLFSAFVVLAVQGSVALLAGLIEPFITDPLLDVFCMVGYALVLAIGFNFVTDSKIKVANWLPALIIPIIYHFVFVL